MEMNQINYRIVTDNKIKKITCSVCKQIGHNKNSKKCDKNGEYEKLKEKYEKLKEKYEMLKEKYEKLDEEKIYEEENKDNKENIDKISNYLKKEREIIFYNLKPTKNGETKKSGNIAEKEVEKMFKNLCLYYDKVSSQKPSDFRNVRNNSSDKNGINIEVKKTDGNRVIFNDTCPCKDIYYIIFCTKNKKILFVNGSQFLKNSSWINEYNFEITKIKDKYARGENKKKLSGCMSVYPRPTYSADISLFF